MQNKGFPSTTLKCAHQSGVQISAPSLCDVLINPGLKFRAVSLRCGVLTNLGLKFRAGSLRCGVLINLGLKYRAVSLRCGVLINLGLKYPAGSLRCGVLINLGLILSLPRCYLKMTNKRANFENLKPFCVLFALAFDRIFIKTYGTESRCVIGP